MSISRSAHPRRTFPAVVAASLVGGALVVLLPGSALANRGANGGGDGHGNGPARNVIFINGDGMGAAHREAARLDQEGLDGQLAMDSLPATGLQTTDPRDPQATITDSAAAATAWATGQKTYNGAISVDVNKNPLLTLGAEAERAGKATGIVTTAQVTDASPAAFFSNTPDRGKQSEIAEQYLEVTRPEVILGGGEDWWLPAGTVGAYADAPADDPTEASKGSRGDLISQAKRQGYQYVTNGDELDRARGDRLLGLFSNEEMFQQRPDGAGDEYDPVVPLPDMTKKALDTLSRDRDGFFLVVEEEAVDEMSHDDTGTRMLQAMRALDDAVQVARDYVALHPDTLLIVTGDHECGGLTVEGVDAADESGPGGTLDGTPAVGAQISGEDGPFTVAGSDKQYVLDWTTAGHTGAPTVVTAEGPRSDELIGYYPNTHLHDVMHEVLFGRR
jgi:alkaline phosphatase